MEFLDQIPLVDQIPVGLRIGVTRFLVAIVIFALFWLLRYAVASVLFRPLRNRVENTDRQGDDALLEAVTNLTSYLMVGLGIIAATLIVGLPEGAYNFFRNIGLSLVAYGVFKGLWDALGFFISSKERIEHYTPFEVERQMVPLLRNGLKVVIIGVAITVIGQLWGIQIAGIIAGIGLVGLAFSLAAKEVLDDFFAFLVIVSDEVYAPGEYIVSPHAEGIVEKIGLRSTRVRQRNQGLVIAPNANMVNDSVLNWSRLEKRWLNFTVGLTYQTTTQQIDEFAKQVHEMLVNRETVEPDSVAVLFTEFEDSALSLMIRAYIRIEDYIEAKAERHRVNVEIMRIADEAGVEMAFPSRSLYLEQMPSIGLQNQNGSDEKQNRPGEPERQLYGVQFKEGGQSEEAHADDNQIGDETYADEDE